LSLHSSGGDKELYSDVVIYYSSGDRGVFHHTVTSACMSFTSKRFCSI